MREGPRRHPPRRLAGRFAAGARPGGAPRPARSAGDRAARAGALAAGLVLLLASASQPARAQGADGRFAERRSSHFVLRQDVAIDDYHGPGGARAFEREVLAVLEAGHDELEARLGLRPPRTLAIHVWDPERFDARFAGLFPFPAAGFYGGTIHVRGATAVTGRLRGTLLHELVHATFDAAAPSLVLPAWLGEGLAEWFESRARGSGRLTRAGWARLAAAARSGGLPTLGELSRPGLAGLRAERAGLAYLYAHGLVDSLARRHGEDALRRLAEELVRTGDLRRTFRRVAGGQPAELDAAFREELRNH